MSTHRPCVRAHFTCLLQEVQAVPPFFCAQTCFPGEVVEMGDETLEDVGQAWIFALRVESDDIVGDVVNGKVLARRQMDRAIRLCVFCHLRKRVVECPNLVKEARRGIFQGGSLKLISAGLKVD